MPPTLKSRKKYAILKNHKGEIRCINNEELNYPFLGDYNPSGEHGYKIDKDEELVIMVTYAESREEALKNYELNIK